MSEDAVSIERSGVPTGRLPKEVWGVTLVYREETYPDWPRTASKVRKKRQHWLFTKKSSQTKLLETLAKLDVLDDMEVIALHGSIEWTEVELVEVEAA
jgi:hypothetical protein